MTEADIYIRNFLQQCHQLGERLRLRAELRRLVVECKQAADTGDRKGAQSLLREAERIRSKLET